MPLDIILGLQGKVDVEFQNEVKTLIQIVTENRNRLLVVLFMLYHRFSC